MSEYIDNFKDFLLKENKYDIDSILDKINKSGINSLSFYEKKILENPDIQKKLLYQYSISLYKVKELLNDFLSPMTEVIFKHKGTIDKYVGDMIMAFWGAPLKDEEHVFNALSAAVEMQNKVVALSVIFKEKKFPDVQIGIGLNTGMMSVGDMGSVFRRNYTVLGDSVNVASRAESLTKYYGVKTIVTQYTQHQNFTSRLLDRVRVKGRNNSIALYELKGYAADTTATLREEIQQSDAALAYYFNQEWDKARNAFTALHQRYPAVHLYDLYLERIATYIATPPEQPWDGTYTHTEK